MEFGHRIKAIADAYDISLNTLSEKCGLKRSTLQSYFGKSGGKAPAQPTLAVVNEIWNAFPNVNLTWLVTGDGKIFTESNELSSVKITEELNVDYKERYLNLAERMIQVQDELVRAKHELIECLKAHRTTAKQVEAVY